MIVPEVKGNQCSGLTLLHVRFARPPARRRDARRCSRATAAATPRSRDAVTETEPTFRDDLLADLPVVELLTAPVLVLAVTVRSRP